MPGIARDAGQDVAGGPIIQGSPNVTANNKPVARIGDAVAGHGPGAHGGPVMAQGSPNVITNNIPTSREGDLATCGHPSTGSGDVFINEPGQNIDGIFIPENPYQTIFVKKFIEETGSNAPHDDPDSTVVPYGIPDNVPQTANDNAPTDDTPGSKDEGKPTDCGEYSTDPVDYNQKLTANFTVKNLSIGAVFAHDIVAQNGLSVADIICNLKALAENILEPLKTQYPGFRINSGFRKGTSTSQHNKGMSCDLQWPGISPADYTPIAFWIRDNLPFDQLIFEHGNSIWLHISYNRSISKQRNALLTYYPKVSPNYKPGLTNHYA